MFLKLAVRDTLLIVAIGALWKLVGERSAGTGAMADLVGFAAGAAFAFAAHLLHEWGHILGGLLSGGVVHANRSLAAVYTFSFDSEKSTLRQFVISSLGGFAATAVVVALAYFVLPEEWLATRVARGGALFLASLGVTLEVPLLLFAIVTGEIPAAASLKIERATPVAE